MITAAFRVINILWILRLVAAFLVRYKKHQVDPHTDQTDKKKAVMLNSADIVFFVITTLEAAVIIIGNMFTIFVFWSQRSHLKRTYFLLINLAVADLLVGLTEPIVLGTEKIPKRKAGPSRDAQRMDNPSSVFQVLGSSTSVIFLALISLERAHAVLRPFRHRVTSTRVYNCAIVTAWMTGLCIAATKMLAMYHNEVDSVYAGVIIHSCLFLFVLVICGSYLTIRTRLRSAAAELDVQRHKSAKHQLRLSRTFFIVAAVSLVFWVPAIIVYTIMSFCRKECGFSPSVAGVVNCLHLANSMVNPFVYCFRMSMFKKALKKCCGRRAEDNESTEVHFDARNGTVVFTTHL